MSQPYQPIRPSADEYLPLRGGRYHLRRWPGAQAIRGGPALLVMLHGWMDVGASFQFVVDHLHASRHIVAADWRGFGHTTMPETDSYWFPDYLGDLDALLDQLSPDQPVDLLGHSMGGNVVMGYAGVRPERIRRLINLEGFGMPATRPQDAARRLRQWLDELRQPAPFRDYESVDAVADRLVKNNPRLALDRARWLAPHWAQPRADGRWHILGDPAHKRVNPMLYQRDETVETWREISAPLLWVEGAQTDMSKWWGKRYPRADFDQRLGVVKTVERRVLDDCGHMLHLDQPEALARLIDHFLG